MVCHAKLQRVFFVLRKLIKRLCGTKANVPSVLFLLCPSVCLAAPYSLSLTLCAGPLKREAHLRNYATPIALAGPPLAARGGSERCGQRAAARDWLRLGGGRVVLFHSQICEPSVCPTCERHRVYTEHMSRILECERGGKCRSLGRRRCFPLPRAD